MPTSRYLRQYEALTIASSGTTTAYINAQDVAIFGIILPAAFTSTTISFTVSNLPQGTYVALYDETGVLVSVPVVAGRAYALPPALAAFPFFKIVSGSAEAATRSIIAFGKG